MDKINMGDFSKNLEKAIYDAAKNAINNREYEVTCPHCDNIVTVPTGESLCPACSNRINLTLDIDL